MPLTDAACRGARPGETRRKHSDGGGLQLWIQPSGAKLWQLIYQFGGKQRQLSLGPYPQVPLLDARSKREEAKRLLREGIDPAARFRAQPRPGDTFKEVAEEFLAKRRAEKLADITMEKKEWLLSFAYPSIGAMHLEKIRPLDVLTVLKDVEGRGCYETARRLRSTIGAVFRFGIATARADTDPTASLRGAIIVPRATPRAAITDPIKFGALLRAIDGFGGQPTTTAALKLLALLFPRPGELRYAKWPEFNFADAIWVIPATRTKMRREHRMPLPKQAVEILLGLRNLTGAKELLFPSLQGRGKPISENTLNGALRRMGYGSDEMTSHGFRASASTLLNESGKWSPDAIERQLAHIDTNGVRRAYARGAYWNERVAMMAWWANCLDELRQSNSKDARKSSLL